MPRSKKGQARFLQLVLTASEHMQSVNKLVMACPSVMTDKPVIAGTRITVELVLDKLAAGETVEQIPDAHADLPVMAFKPHGHSQLKPYAPTSSIPLMRPFGDVWGRRRP